MFEKLKEMIDELIGVENSTILLNPIKKRVELRKILQRIKIESHQLRKDLQKQK
jgi:hypothetical protein